MNFLAHLYLADDTPASMVGNLLPDLVRGPLPDGLPEAVLAGVRTHRRVDAFTDTHPVFARSRRRLRPAFGIFSGVLVDMCYDHVLARDWERYHDESLEGFVAHAHATLAGHRHLMPWSMARVIPHMTSENWLQSYATIEGMRGVLGRMSQRFTQRLKRDVDLAPAADFLDDHAGAFTDDFEQFFPQLVRHIGAARGLACMERTA